MDKNLATELFERYSDQDKPKIHIRPLVKGKNAVKALLNKEPAEILISITQQSRVEKNKNQKDLKYIKSNSKKADFRKIRKELTHEQIKKLKDVYQHKNFKDRRKSKRDSIQYLAEEWGVSRGLISRRAKEMSLCIDYRQEWSPEETKDLIEVASIYPFAFISEEMICRGHSKRTEKSFRTKIASLNIKKDINQMKYRTIKQEAQIQNLPPEVIRKTMPIIQRGSIHYVVN